MTAIRNLEKPFEKKEKTCCCVDFALRAKSTQQQIILPLFRNAASMMSVWSKKIFAIHSFFMQKMEGSF